jgi:hypothetical protein
MFVNFGDSLTKVYRECPRDQLASLYGSDDMFMDVGNFVVTSTLTGSKQWTVVQIPSAYSSTNWPIRVSRHAVLGFIPINVFLDGCHYVNVFGNGVMCRIHHLTLK